MFISTLHSNSSITWFFDLFLQMSWTSLLVPFLCHLQAQWTVLQGAPLWHLLPVKRVSMMSQTRCTVFREDIVWRHHWRNRLKVSWSSKDVVWRHLMNTSSWSEDIVWKHHWRNRLKVSSEDVWRHHMNTSYEYIFWRHHLGASSEGSPGGIVWWHPAKDVATWSSPTFPRGIVEVTPCKLLWKWSSRELTYRGCMTLDLAWCQSSS